MVNPSARVQSVPPRRHPFLTFPLWFPHDSPLSPSPVTLTRTVHHLSPSVALGYVLESRLFASHRIAFTPHITLARGWVDMLRELPVQWHTGLDIYSQYISIMACSVPRVCEMSGFDGIEILSRPMLPCGHDDWNAWSTRGHARRQVRSDSQKYCYPITMCWLRGLL